MDLDAHIPYKTFQFIILINRDPYNTNYHRDARQSCESLCDLPDCRQQLYPEKC